jgi:hypothetical protein
MAYIVERYLPGLDRAQLLRSLERLERVTADLRREGTPVRYVGSTIVVEDEACFCTFEAMSEEAVAEANRRARISYDRIVAAVAVRETPTQERSDPVPTRERSTTCEGEHR